MTNYNVGLVSFLADIYIYIYIYIYQPKMTSVLRCSLSYIHDASSNLISNLKSAYGTTDVHLGSF